MKNFENFLKNKKMNFERAIRILGVNEDATETDIKRAYRKGALKYHPDKNGSEDAHVKFKEISDAYQYLTESTTNNNNPGREVDPFEVFNHFFQSGFGHRGFGMSSFSTPSPFESFHDDFFNDAPFQGDPFRHSFFNQDFGASRFQTMDDFFHGNRMNSLPQHPQYSRKQQEFNRSQAIGNYGREATGFGFSPGMVSKSSSTTIRNGIKETTTSITRYWFINLEMELRKRREKSLIELET
jgi:DnaJ-class molecular chaperone